MYAPAIEYVDPLVNVFIPAPANVKLLYDAGATVCAASYSNVPPITTPEVTATVLEDFSVPELAKVAPVPVNP